MSRKCKETGCEKRELARGWCGMHYERWRKHGDPSVSLLRQSKAGAPAKFIESALSYSGDECLLWPFCVNNQGYAQVNNAASGKKLVHRLICEIKNGSPPAPHYHAAHSCGNGHLGCITPAHLRWATPKENAEDRVIHGRSRRGVLSPTNKITEADVHEIVTRMECGESQSAVAKKFGISQKAVSKIFRGQMWGWLTERASGPRKRTTLAKLTASQALEIFERANGPESQRTIAAAYGICQELVSQIKTGKAWCDATGALPATRALESATGGAA